MHAGKKLIAGALTAAATGAAVIGISVSSAAPGSPSTGTPGTSVAATAAVATGATTATPIKHVVVLFDENVSFDHYFGTYPNAQNLPGENPFTAAPNTPSVNGLNNTLLTANPNAANPARLSPAQALTCDQNHSYTPEQSAFDGGAMDKFIGNTSGAGCTQTSTPNGEAGNYGNSSTVMDYYDGNTVTGLWNLAQHFTLSDNSYDTQFGPSSPGAISVVSGNTSGATAEGGTTTNIDNGVLQGDAEPYYDECSNAGTASTSDYAGTNIPAPGGVTAALSTKNIGDDLNTAGLTWGWFQGGFTPSSYNSNGTPACGTSHTNIGGASVADYSEHHEPFQYYASTSNPQHLSPANVGQVGVSTNTAVPAGINHQYDLSWFNQAVASGDMPAVSYLKAPEYEDGHAGYSDPTDEQRFIVNEINAIEQSPDWSSTAIFISYDDSDGWYDHQMSPIVRGSDDATDTLDGSGHCGSQTSAEIAAAGTEGRCGDGPRLPLLVISPYAKQNYIDNTLTDQSSIPKFIEQNWGLPALGDNSTDAAAGSLLGDFDFSTGAPLAPAIIMDPTTGEVTQTIPTTPPSTTSSSSSSTSTTSSSTSTSTTTTSSTTTSPTTTGAGSGSGDGNANGNKNGNNNGSTVTVTVNNGSGSSTPSSNAIETITAPKVALAERFSGNVMTLVATTKGGTKDVATELRARVFRGSHLIGNKAARVHNHRATFRINLRKQTSGTFKSLVTADTAGKVTLTKKSVRR